MNHGGPRRNKMEDLEDKIRELGNILNSYEMVENISHEGITGYSGDGHSFDDKPIYSTVIEYEKVYNYSKKERKNALKELKKLRRKNKDKNIGKLIDDQFYDIRKERKEKIKGGMGCLAKLVLASVIVFGMYSCIQYRNERARKKNLQEIPPTIEYISDIKIRDDKIDTRNNLKRNIEDGKDYLHVFNETIVHLNKEIKILDDRIEKVRYQTKERIEKGYLTPKNRYYKDYEKIFGNEEWWPKEK